MSLETVTPRNERGWGLSGAHDPMEEDGHGWGPETLPTQPHPVTPPSWDWACWDTSPTINPLPLTAVAEELQREVAEAGFGDCPASPALPTLSPESDALSDYAPSPRDSAGDGDVEGLARVADVADGMSVVETPLLFDAFTDRSEDPYSPTPWPPANPHNDNTDLFADLDVSGGGGVLSAATPGDLGGMEVHATPPAFPGTPTPAHSTETDAIEMSEGAPSENGSHGMEGVSGGTRRSTRRTRRQGSFAIKPDPDDFDDDDAPYSPVPHVARRTATGCGKAKVRVKTEPWLTDQHSQMLAHAGAAMAEAQDSKSWHTAEDAAPNRRRRTKETEEIRDELDAAIYSLFPMWTLRLDRTEFKEWRATAEMRELTAAETKRLAQIRRTLLARVYAERTRQRKKFESEAHRNTLATLQHENVELKRRIAEFERVEAELKRQVHELKVTGQPQFPSRFAPR